MKECIVIISSTSLDIMLDFLLTDHKVTDIGAVFGLK